MDRNSLFGSNDVETGDEGVLGLLVGTSSFTDFHMSFSPGRAQNSFSHLKIEKT